MLWREQRLIVELDSRTHHDTAQAFEQDRDRDLDLLIAGFSTVRVTARRLRTRPDHEARRLATLPARDSRSVFAQFAGPWVGAPPTG